MMPFDYAGARGCVVANELDEKRSNMLVHQCKRMRLLYPFAVFTNHDARYFPNLVVNNAPQQGGGGAASSAAAAASGGGGGVATNSSAGEFFDKIMCDVMCSGDGTLRKAPGLLRAWKPFEAAHLQKSQIQVVLRGIHLLRVGGRLAYSTCSMNPIENEAVVTQILLRTNGAVRLVDPRSILPRLPCDPGLRTWKIMKNDGTVAEGPEPAPSHLHPSLFPVPEADLPLERCMRLLPHHTDGGGFFVALFEKVAPWSIAVKDDEEKQQQDAADKKKKADAAAAVAAAAASAGNNNNEAKKDEDDDASANEAKKKKGGGGYGLPPHALLPFAPAPRDIVEGEIVSKFNINLAKFPVQNLLYRTNMQQAEAEQQAKEEADAAAAATGAGGGGDEQQQQKKQQHKLSERGALQLAASGVRDLLLHPQRNLSLRVSAAGLRTFVAQPGIGAWRIANEASAIAAVGMVPPPGSTSGNPRLISGVSVADVLPMLQSGPLKDITFDQIENEELRKQMQALESSSVVLFLVKSNLSVANNSNYVVACPVLRAKTRIQLLVDGEDLEGLQCRLGIPPQPKPVRGAKKGQEQEEKKSEDD